MLNEILQRLRRDDRGTALVLIGAGAAALVGTAGLSIDSYLLYSIEDRLQRSLDAAALAAGQVSDPAGVQAEAERIFLNNFEATGPAAQLLPPGLAVSVSAEGDRIALEASARYLTQFVQLAGVPHFDVSGRSVVLREVRPSEVALVLDITGSMESGDKIGAMRAAAVSLVDILFGANGEHPNLFVSVVPYTSTVNVDPVHTDWLAGYDPDAFGDDPQGWKGCVMARANGGDVTDAPPSDQPFEAFHSPADIDNVYPPVNATQSARNNGTGPNLGCGSPILPLTNVKATVRDEILGLLSWHRGGTTSNLGLVWGWRTVSPNWQGLWGLPDRPVAQGENETRKAVVILTDGENQFWPNYTRSGEGESPGGSDFTAYGRLADLEAATGGRVQTLNDGIDELNARFLAVCDSMKAEEIDVFTITFGLTKSSQESTRDVYRQCASKPEFYFNSPTTSELEKVFRTVGIRLSGLRIVE